MTKKTGIRKIKIHCRSLNERNTEQNKAFVKGIYLTLNFLPSQFPVRKYYFTFRLAQDCTTGQWAILHKIQTGGGGV